MMKGIHVPAPGYRRIWSTGGMTLGLEKLKHLERNLSRYHFVHQKSHTDYPGIEARPIYDQK
jgi:hypothetical protein